MSEVYYTKKISCPYCQTSFETYKVRVNKARFLKRDADYCPYYEKENPLLYEVHTCPHCGLAFTESFSTKLNKTQLETLKMNYIEKIESKPTLCMERDLDNTLRAYKLALYAATLLNEQKLIIANIALRIAWLYRYQHIMSEEQRFLKNVLDIYLEIYENDDLEHIQMDKYLLFYLIGELHGRLGDYEKVTRWFSMIIEDKQSTPKILTMTKERWQEYRDVKAKK